MCIFARLIVFIIRIDDKGLFFVVLCGVRDIGGLEFGSGGDVWVEDKEFKRKGKIGCV